MEIEKMWSKGEKKYKKFIEQIGFSKYQLMTPRTSTLEDLAYLRFGTPDFIKIALTELTKNFT